MSDERVARILNGSIVLVASVLTLIDRTFVWLVLFMGVSLVFSGLSGFCGFKVILAKLPGRRDTTVGPPPTGDDVSRP